MSLGNSGMNASEGTGPRAELIAKTVSLLNTLQVGSLTLEEEKDKQQVKKIILAMLVSAAGSVAFANSIVVVSFINPLPATQGNGTTNVGQALTYNGEANATIGGSY